MDVQAGNVKFTPLVRPANALPVKARPPVLKVREEPVVAEGMPALVIGLLGAAVAGYHGYARNESWGWAALWATGGFVCPVVTLPLAIHQGYANRKV